MNLLTGEKKRFRDQIRRELDQLELARYEELNILLSENLFRFLNQVNVISEKKIIGAYAPIKKEPLWYKSFSVDNLNLVFPSFDIEKNKMVFKKAKLDELVLLNDFGFEINGPKLDAPNLDPEVLLIPGIGFSRKGDRLGRGKGFFDKFLENFRGVKVGIGFEMQVFESIPTETHDEKLNWLITEKNIYKF